MTPPIAPLPLAQQRCSHQSGPALAPDAQAALLPQLAGWSLEGHGRTAVLTRTFTFADFHATMAFVNAVAAIAHEQDHHPDMQVSYNRCTLSWSTHSVGGLSINDFICAAHVDALAA
ncbi:4a-hydroxytetrahydrobiopterin dehydratase [Aquabacterium fontiphilum]|jgi:4a-hydroxytetrahydrobiopterin dehydratase|uniref:4a-hydroxytetrahydrobiopterin dehydratase n=1 Tax=Aquabacterium fontiphilum TaxID=450365 RepID=UPI001378413D|nr:4a-hydroxytetrahydrobiopterin dehydratase [Aquabacterium fontiphilum]NBD19650.1 4a-hydroxytetrahydrobiopterin dehydratase [Aquabacterium fontiphilum]